MFRSTLVSLIAGAMAPFVVAQNSGDPAAPQAPDVASLTHSVAFVTRESDERIDLNGDGDTSDYVQQVYEHAWGRLTNLALATDTQDFQLQDNWVVFKVLESNQDRTDLNGDGDVNDPILHAFNLKSRALGSVAIAAYNLVLDEHHVAFLVNESSQSNSDLNGDGDISDNVMHVHHLESSTTTNLMAAAGVHPHYLSQGRLGFDLPEYAQRVDLNGDGDQSDSVTHVYDVNSATLVNLGLAGWVFAVKPFWMAFDVSESSQGTDLNGDTDVSDNVPCAYHTNSGYVEVIPYAGGWEDVTDHYGTFTVIEWGGSFPPGLDLNGDGDINDYISWVFHPQSSMKTNLGLATIYDPSKVKGDLVALRVTENMQGKTDLNGDGSIGDFVVFVYDAASQTLNNTQLEVSNYQVSDDGVVFSVREDYQGQQDLNNDGDISDTVTHVYDRAHHVVRNLGLASHVNGHQLLIVGSTALFTVSEPGQAGIDLNGDGDALDYYVLHAYNMRSRRLDNLGVAVAQYTFALPTEDFVALTVHEPQEGQDLNGDGDQQDYVLHVYSVPNRRLVNIGRSAISFKAQ